MESKYYTIKQMLEMIDEPNRTACSRILTDNRKLFQTVPGSTHNHQAWPGGYFDHVQEIMNISVAEYDMLNSRRRQVFSLSDLLLVVFLHDLEKPWKYELGEAGQLRHKSWMQTKRAAHQFRMTKLTEYDVVLTPKQENGLTYAEGELDDYTNRRRVMEPLAAVAHACDVIRARVWFDHPMQEDDPWRGAKRIRD